MKGFLQDEQQKAAQVDDEEEIKLCLWRISVFHPLHTHNPVCVCCYNSSIVRQAKGPCMSLITRRWQEPLALKVTSEKQIRAQRLNLRVTFF